MFSLGEDFEDQPLRNITSQDVLPFFRTVVTGPDTRQHACLCITSQAAQKGRPLTAGPPLFTTFSSPSHGYQVPSPRLSAYIDSDSFSIYPTLKVPVTHRGDWQCRAKYLCVLEWHTVQ